MILKKIELKKRLRLRVLCSRIKEIIEAIGVGQKSLIITTTRKENFLVTIEELSPILTLEHDHFLTDPNWDESAIVIKPQHFSRLFADLIHRLFPKVKQLFFAE